MESFICYSKSISGLLMTKGQQSTHWHTDTQLSCCFALASSTTSILKRVENNKEDSLVCLLLGSQKMKSDKGKQMLEPED